MVISNGTTKQNYMILYVVVGESVTSLRLHKTSPDMSSLQTFPGLKHVKTKKNSYNCSLNGWNMGLSFHKVWTWPYNWLKKTLFWRLFTAMLGHK